MDKEQITKRIEELVKERQDFAQRVNMQIAFYNGALDELKKLLAQIGQEETSEEMPDDTAS